MRSTHVEVEAHVLYGMHPHDRNQDPVNQGDQQYQDQHQISARFAHGRHVQSMTPVAASKKTLWHVTGLFQ
ncbi:MAG TPA: hypothetical protein VJX23_10950 [Candidatus Binataceae bacterium]|nr:hypothetical protein [Candidatus Binataceae bacterium]